MGIFDFGKREIGFLKQEIENLKQQLSDLTVKYDNLEFDYQTLKEENDKLRKENNLLKSKNSELSVSTPVGTYENIEEENKSDLSISNMKNEISSHNPIVVHTIKSSDIRENIDKKYELSSYYLNENNLEKALIYFAQGVFIAMNYGAVDGYRKFLELKNSDVPFDAELNFEDYFYHNMHYFDELYEKLSIEYQDLKKLLISVFSDVSYENRVISDEELAELLVSRLSNDRDKCKEILKKAENRILNNEVQLADIPILNEISIADFDNMISQCQAVHKAIVKKKKKICNMTRTELTVVEVLLIYYAPTYTTTQTAFQSFWFYKYGMKDIDKKLQNFQEQGYITEAEPVESLEYLSVTELKELLKKLGQKISGKKSELVERIKENADSKFFDKNIKIRNYALTEKGQSELNQNEHVIYFHKNNLYELYGINVYWANELFHKNPLANLRREIEKKLLEEMPRIREEMNSQSCNRYKGCTYYFCTLSNYYIEEKNMENALFFICQSVFYSFNGNGVLSYESSVDYDISYDLGFEHFVYLHIDVFKTLYEMMKLEYSDFKQKIISDFYRIIFCDRIISDKDLAELIISKLQGDEKTSNAIFRDTEKRIRNKVMKRQNELEGELISGDIRNR